MIVIDQVFSIFRLPFFVRTGVYMYLRTGAARPRITHLPEIIFFITEQYPVFRDPFFPLRKSFFIPRQSFLCIAFENGHVQAVFRNAVHTVSSSQLQAIASFLKVRSPKLQLPSISNMVW